MITFVRIIESYSGVEIQLVFNDVQIDIRSDIKTIVIVGPIFSKQSVLVQPAEREQIFQSVITFGYRNVMILLETVIHHHAYPIYIGSIDPVVPVRNGSRSMIFDRIQCFFRELNS